MPAQENVKFSPGGDQPRPSTLRARVSIVSENVVSGAKRGLTAITAVPATPNSAKMNKKEAFQRGLTRAYADLSNQQSDMTLTDVFELRPRKHDQLPILRFSSFLAMWIDRGLAITALWTAIWAPYAAAFDLDESAFHIRMYYFDFVLTFLYFVFAVVFRFFTSIPNLAKGKEYTDHEKICGFILRSGPFWADVISSSTVIAGPRPTAKWLLVVQMPRVWRLWAVPPSHVEVVFTVMHYFARVLLWFVLVSHWTSCVWYSVVLAAGSLNFHTQMLFEERSYGIYPFAFYSGVYVLLARARHAYTDGEQLLLAIAGIFGGLFCALVYGHIAGLVRHANIMTSRQNAHMSFVRSAAKALSLNRSLRYRIVKYHHYLSAHHNMAAFHQLLSGLSVNLAIELKMFLFSQLFKESPFFQAAPGHFVTRVATILQERSYSPGDLIIRRGELGCEMYWIIKGKCDVLDEGGQVIVELRENSYFGEVAIIFDTERTASVRANTYCLLAIVTRERFIPLLKEFPEMDDLFLESLPSYVQGSDEIYTTEAFSTDYSTIEEETEEEMAKVITCKNPVLPAPTKNEEEQVGKKVSFPVDKPLASLDSNEGDDDLLDLTMSSPSLGRISTSRVTGNTGIGPGGGHTNANSGRDLLTRSSLLGGHANRSSAVEFFARGSVISRDSIIPILKKTLSQNSRGSVTQNSKNSRGFGTQNSPERELARQPQPLEGTQKSAVGSASSSTSRQPAIKKSFQKSATESTPRVAKGEKRTSFAGTESRPSVARGEKRTSFAGNGGSTFMTDSAVAVAPNVESLPIDFRAFANVLGHAMVEQHNEVMKAACEFRNKTTNEMERLSERLHKLENLTSAGPSQEG